MTDGGRDHRGNDKDENQHEYDSAGIRHRERILREAGQTHRQPRPDNRQDKDADGGTLTERSASCVGAALSSNEFRNDLVRKWTSAQSAVIRNPPSSPSNCEIDDADVSMLHWSELQF